MKRRLSLILMVGLASAALAQNQPTLEQLQKMYDNTQELLKNAQDRKNELSIENQNLQKHVAELEQKLARVDNVLIENYALRQQEALWKSFLQYNAEVKVMWIEFVAAFEKINPFPKTLGSTNWPFGDD